jgi:hypothetical protein
MLRHVTPSRAEILANLSEIRARIVEAATRSGRELDDVTVVAAAKTVEADSLRWAAEAGVTAIGHNYVQELAASRDALSDPSLRWHYIGALRSGSASRVADLADVIETVTGERAARRLAGRAARSDRLLDVLIEVDFTGGRRPPPRPRHRGSRRHPRGRSPPGPDDGTAALPDRGGGPDLVREAAEAPRPGVQNPSRRAGTLDGDVVGLRGRRGGRRYDGAHRNGLVRSSTRMSDREPRS